MRTNHDIKRGVSLYSYQDNYYLRKMTLEDCVAAVAGVDAEGMEIVPDAMLPGFPHLTDDFVNTWYGWMERYDVEAACLTHFADRAMHKNKTLSDDELFDRSVMYIKAAHKLGAKVIRLLHSGHVSKISPYDLVNVDITERLLPVAAEHDVMMAIEVHSPSTIDDPVHIPYLELVEKTGIPYVGLAPDASSFTIRDHQPSVDWHIRYGGTPEIIEYLRDMGSKKAMGEDVDVWEVKEKVDKMNPTFMDKVYFYKQMIHAPVATKNSLLKEYASKCVYVHAKFNWANEDGTIDEIDYPGFLKAMVEGGYKGYINSEFEGNRWLNDLGEVDEVEQVRRQHIVFKEVLGY